MLNISLILRKREVLSRRMGGMLRSLRPILRDGRDGPPQDEEVFAMNLSNRLAKWLRVERCKTQTILAKRSARRVSGQPSVLSCMPSARCRFLAPRLRGD